MPFTLLLHDPTDGMYAACVVQCLAGLHGHCRILRQG